MSDELPSRASVRRVMHQQTLPRVFERPPWSAKRKDITYVHISAESFSPTALQLTDETGIRKVAARACGALLTTTYCCMNMTGNECRSAASLFVMHVNPRVCVQASFFSSSQQSFSILVGVVLFFGASRSQRLAWPALGVEILDADAARLTSQSHPRAACPLHSAGARLPFLANRNRVLVIRSTYEARSAQPRTAW